MVSIARELLGKVLLTNFEGRLCSGMIVETEAYAGPADKASHAYGGKHTPRTAPMFGPGGTAYVYLIYGMYDLFNIVTHEKGVPHAVLIRAIEPIEGIDTMLERRGMETLQPRITAGPGVLSQALGITRKHSGMNLQGPEIWVENRGILIPPTDLIAGSRVGVSYAGEDALLPYRFSVRGNPYVSKGKGLPI